MSTIAMNKKDELVMKLVHYFITEENYTPIIVNGVKDEIWLENDHGAYKIVRINSNYIHNAEQYKFDMFKTKNVMRQVKKKTLSLSMNALNILLDVNEDVELKEDKNISAIKVKSERDIKKKNGLAKFFPMVEDKLISDTKGLDLIINVTKDINEKTEKENKRYEAIFKPKKIVFTHIIIAICVIMFALTYLLGSGSNDTLTLLRLGANYGPLVRLGQIWRIISCAFLHAGLVHLIFNMYALFIIGTQVETYVGKWRFLAIYLISAASGSLLSMAFSNAVSVGASGAIFGLMGCLLYFGYHYRMYLGNVLKSQIIPLIVLNLVFGFMASNVDNAAHIGGLIGGLLTSIAVGVKDKTGKTEQLNGIIVLILYLIFISYLAFSGIGLK